MEEHNGSTAHVIFPLKEHKGTVWKGKAKQARSSRSVGLGQAFCAEQGGIRDSKTDLQNPSEHKGDKPLALETLQ